MAEKEYIEFNIPSFDQIAKAFKKNKNNKEPTDTITIKKYKITEKELKEQYGIKEEIKNIKITENNNIEIETIKRG